MNFGFVSLSNYVRSVKPKNFKLILPEPDRKSLDQNDQKQAQKHASEKESQRGHDDSQVSEEKNGPLVVDVRTKEEFAQGAYPGALNIPLDDLEGRLDELGDKDREIVLYCASGARSAYALKMLKRNGFINAENGGGIAKMMARYKSSAM